MPYVGMYVWPNSVQQRAPRNVRTFLTFDVVYRYLSFLGYQVRYVRTSRMSVT